MKKNLIVIGVIVLIVLVVGIYLLNQQPVVPLSENENPTSSPSGTTLEGTPIQTHQVEISGFAFSPSTLTIQPGDSVTWTNQDIAPHTIVSDSGSEISSSSLSNGETFSYTFNTIGTFKYHCSIHPAMKGTIIVE